MKTTISKTILIVAASILLATDAGAVADQSVGEFAPRDPQPSFMRYQEQLNLYQFVGNDPLNRADPFGLWQIYSTVGVDAFAVLGFKYGWSLVFWDSKDVGRIGAYESFGAGAGVNFGAGVGWGFARDTVEGRSSYCDLNAGAWSASIVGVPNRPMTTFTGAEFQLGPGEGVSYSETDTKPWLTVREIFKRIKRKLIGHD